MRRRRWWAVAALAGLAVAAAGAVILLVARAGLDTADKVASVIGAAAAVVFGGAGLWLASRPQQQPNQQINRAEGDGTVYGVQGGNLIIGDPAAPDDR
ncbi:hypothetical protein AB0M02_20870 [Actinoplanes sp. NPDC051861]|uniref:hypothetical protein n=1 Tax=Actinoplanes sp. NPDC051861 TaxID=3155170 RepID=UPI00342394A0